MRHIIAVLCTVALGSACANEGVNFAWEVTDGPGDDASGEDEDIQQEQTPAPPPEWCAAAVEDFVACADEELWNDYELDVLPYSQTVGWGPCHGCHSAGVGIQLDTDVTPTVQSFPFQRLVNCESDEQGDPVLTPTFLLENHGTSNNPHPRYVFVPRVSDAFGGFVAAAIDCSTQ